MKTPASNKRKLTICRRSVMDGYRNYKHLPAINISGAWLREIGFEIGQIVEITYVSEQLIITISDISKNSQPTGGFSVGRSFGKRKDGHGRYQAAI